ncbi:MAG: putative O-methyltransferase [Herbaspirillum frisingense]|uniref:Putative O-methyltransferase n=1 Tax=Herbaspirillum frisingense TaxID=92645 RepID=A0A7V8JTD1_9BURK|nr:MAG: putative O-methyltransferase [Herbaspirillum frisingense]
MTTLTTSPVAAVLDRLFAQAAVTSPQDSLYVAKLGDDELDRLLRSKTEYLDFYSELKHLPLAVSRDTGALLYMLATSIKARNVIEFGTSLGVSTLYLAAALRDNGGGRLITTEFEASKVTRARANLFEAGLADLVEVREGDALLTLAGDLPQAIDLLLLDGAKAIYPEVLKRVESRLRPGALIVADDAAYSQEFLDYVRSSANGYLSVPLADGVELSDLAPVSRTPL